MFDVPSVSAQSGDPRFDLIRQKRERGEALTPEERSYGERVLAQRKGQGAAARNEAYAKQNPPRASTGLIPLSDLGPGVYHHESGGLYPGGGNTPPPLHAKAGLELARCVVPLDQEGRPDPRGKIVLLTCGMSNTTQESQAFIRLAAADPSLNPRVVIIDGAQGAQSAGVTAQADAHYWTVVAQRLRSAGLGAAQVQVAWVKQANPGPRRSFPAEVRQLQADLLATLHHLQQRFPNLKMAYLSSRTYGGYAASPLNPEPHAYESGFAVKWLIADQIAGKPEMNFAPANGAVRVPWLAWGPYLWTDGAKGRKDGLVWTREDCGPDGTHPSESGRAKVGRLLLEFFKTDPTTQNWFLKTSR
ncbi:MAG: hypothetical protein RIQ93_3108 [Verrucomicrobiota bacterium]